MAHALPSRDRGPTATAPMDPVDWIDRCAGRLKQHWPALDWPDADDCACDLHLWLGGEAPEAAADRQVAACRNAIWQ